MYDHTHTYQASQTTCTISQSTNEEEILIAAADNGVLFMHKCSYDTAKCSHVCNLAFPRYNLISNHLPSIFRQGESNLAILVIVKVIT